MRRRWRLDSIAMTVALTVVVAMGLGAALQRVVNTGLEYAGLYPWGTPEEWRTRFSAALFPATVVSLAEALDTVPNAQRLAIITAAIALWNTVYLGRALDDLRRGANARPF